ncbi:hypothetical protein CROQUDRAFT_651889 [Cronartium quercuum f. sp. fusiforme G11]|uniref:SEC7 domain-containing protein n=1 Tax=Cronartium quercuum f. sp. fusiforme G11 TaxID=708437 RepID=A0A9P6NUT5_9BASI|nr:hypothetical protein CROQUDRAFT_651889 [Cronartium quercuum f. sp. fusiforme G11]
MSSEDCEDALEKSSPSPPSPPPPDSPKTLQEPIDLSPVQPQSAPKPNKNSPSDIPEPSSSPRSPLHVEIHGDDRDQVVEAVIYGSTASSGNMGQVENETITEHDPDGFHDVQLEEAELPSEQQSSADVTARQPQESTLDQVPSIQVEPSESLRSPSQASASIPVEPIDHEHANGGISPVQVPLPQSPPSTRKGVLSASSPAISPHSTTFEETTRDPSTIPSSLAGPAPSTYSQSHFSAVLVIASLETIIASKEAKRSQELNEATRAALGLLKGEYNTAGELQPPATPDEEAQMIIKPLRLACQTRTPALMVTALDCIGKLVSYNFFQVQDQKPRIGQDLAPPSATFPTTQEIPDGEDLPGLRMGDQVTGIICDCFADASCPDAVQLQIVKAILALVLAPSKQGGRPLEVHQSSLLRAVRTVYNIFLLSKSPTNQAVAQGALTQMVGHVFGRVETGDAAAARVLPHLAHRKSLIRDEVKPSLTRNATLHRRSSSFKPASELGSKMDTSDDKQVVPLSSQTVDDKTDSPLSDGDDKISSHSQKSLPSTPSKADVKSGTPKPTGLKEEPVTLESFEKRNSFDGVSEKGGIGHAGAMNIQDYYVKDAFLIFRAFCKLSMKPLGAESERDLKSHGMRSKLLSLHLILSILSAHLTMFTDPNVIIFSSSTREQTPFIQAIKQYLCLSLSRNAISSVLSVFELSCEIFWKVVSGMRTRLKKEIEVLLNEIFLPILEMRNSTVKQKSILLAALGRLFHDPQALVEIYLNYDCDRTSLENIYERFMNIVSKLATTQYTTSTTTSQSVELVGSPNAPGLNGANSSLTGASGNSTGIASIPPSLSTTSMLQGMADSTFYSHQAVEAQLKRQSLECLVATLKSLVAWAGKGAVQTVSSSSGRLTPTHGENTFNLTQRSMPISSSSHHLPDADEGSSVETSLPAAVGGKEADTATSSGLTMADREVVDDDPRRFETAKHQKTTLLEGIKQFNFKPKRGIKFLIANGFIRNSKPQEIARFLLTADGLSKAMIGEYLGEGDPENVETMHAFIEFMDFSNMKFTEAMRNFLQAFRLPGEAQKIDRFMLKFAERYFQGNPGTLANAETAYILAFSIIMLNTDAHSPQVKNRMTKHEFLRNNRGINQGADLPEEYLSAVYDEILADEIRMKDEVEAAVGVQHVPSGLAGSIATVGRDLQKEAYVLQSAGMANKTEILFRTLLRGQRNTRESDVFFEASHFKHVRPMFEVVWMPLLAGISDPLQNSDQMDMITLSLNGFKQAIKIVCLFDLELERNAFVTTLAKFTFLNNLGEMKPKNVEAIKTLLDVAMIDGNYLKGSWKDVLACVSQLERFQFISQGVDVGRGPELTRRGSTSKTATKSKYKKPSEEVTGAAGASHITHAADMVFSSSRALSGTAIVDFVKALSDVSWQEIQVSGSSGSPRTFCLQKLVEISYYNMGRIRLEWSQIWAILGDHFNQVCCHPNANVSFFALDSLRQLAMRFLEKEELANFKFQKDFLRPFEHTMIHSSNIDAKDMVLQCLNQMISARVINLRSGWRTMFGVFSAASKVTTERVATQSFEIVQRVNKEHFSQVVAYGSFADMAVCITDFCKIAKFQKISLHAIEMLKSLIPAMLNCSECPLSHSAVNRGDVDPSLIDDAMIKFWFPILFAFYDITMNGEDLEVRKRALDYLFDTLKKHGSSFPDSFWDSVAKEVLFPIFAVLRSRTDVSRFSTHEDMSVWLSTTMIQALRNLIDLYTFYFGTLGRLLDRLLDLLCECICQENDTLARIGTSCLQQLLEKNVRKLDAERWERVVTALMNLFRTTTAYQLFDANLRLPGNDSADVPEPTPSPFHDQSQFIAPTPLTPAPEDEQERTSKSSAPMTANERKRVFRQVIVKCVLQLLLIETTNELLNNIEVYELIPPAQLLRLLTEIDNSYRFAKRFNADKDLRMGLWQVGFMKQLPNLLKQESSSAVTLVQVLVRLYADSRPDHLEKRIETVDAFVPLGLDVIAGYVVLDPETQSRNVAAWTPVVAEVLRGFSIFEKETFLLHLPALYPLLTELLSRDISREIRPNLHQCFCRVGTDALGYNMNSLSSPQLSTSESSPQQASSPA